MPLKDPVARAVYKKKYREDNYDRIRAYDKKRFSTPEARKRAIAYQQIHRIKNRDEIKIKKKQYHKDHHEECLIRDRLYYKDHREERKAKQKQYDKDHPEVNLKAKKKELTKLGKTFDMNCNDMRYALMSWTKTVRKRDNNKCTWCNSTKTLVSHHLWHKSFCPESALDVVNGITLCHKCHMEQHRHDRSDN